MPVSLKEMMKKAEQKEYGTASKADEEQEITRPWQTNSLKFNRSKNAHNSKQAEAHNQTESLHDKNHENVHNKTQKHTHTQNHTQSNHETKHKPTTDKCTNTYTKAYTINRIQGIQRKFLVYIYLECKKNRSLVSTVHSKKEISKKLNINLQSLHNSIQRLVDKGMIIRKDVILGRTGATTYELPETVYDDMLKNEILFMAEKGRHNLYTNADTNPNTQYTNSSSYINNNTTIPDDWKSIDITPLEKFGFNQSRLQQLVKYNNPSVVQESINHFAFALRNNPNTKKYTQDGKNPINVLMGVLRKGGNWFEANYESPKDKALREFVERKKKEKENRDNMINELMLLEFDEWRRSLTEKEIKEIIPVSSYNIKAEAPKTVALQAYYKSKILIPRLEKEGVL